MGIVLGLNDLCFGTLFAPCPMLGLFISNAWIVYTFCYEPENVFVASS